MFKQTMSHLLVLAGVLLLLPTTACSHGKQQPTAARPPSTTPGLTLKDFTARRERRMLYADTDGDQKVSKAEFLASARSGKGDPARRFGRLDRNADGVLDRQEIDAMASRRFRRMDTDGDGILTATEPSASKAAADRNDPED